MTMYVVRIVLPFRDQQSANVLRKQLGALSRKINIAIEPVFKSHKLQDEFRSNEPKPNIINQQCVVYEFQCPLCDARYVAIQPAICSNVLKNIGSRAPPLGNISKATTPSKHRN